ncbi:MAG: CcmD family protein [Gemmatimonadetes bacterium]|nr:CcmD family protein [Gemmatimonadota bacterium]NIR80021.1 CcmD family protein [Gemmatimonadota bacterium]NIT88756.1 CcmD family protein [Gemmatimonadota bacterium]NIU32563.1 CcmD family protein [Gemmatimonadota bacterium]NIU37021.1 CcmD family protein [Gemmatimonadota bacterium]
MAQTIPAGAGEVARQSLRPYAHVFIAYALAWVLVLGWVVSIGRRLGRVEEEVGGGSEG